MYNLGFRNIPLFMPVYTEQFSPLTRLINQVFSEIYTLSINKETHCHSNFTKGKNILFHFIGQQCLPQDTQQMIYLKHIKL